MQLPAAKQGTKTSYYNISGRYEYAALQIHMVRDAPCAQLTASEGGTQDEDWQSYLDQHVAVVSLYVCEHTVL